MKDLIKAIWTRFNGAFCRRCAKNDPQRAGALEAGRLTRVTATILEPAAGPGTILTSVGILGDRMSRNRSM
jgi:hypothetical protein